MAKFTSAKPRIAIVSDSIYPYHKGGKEMRIHELSTRLAAAGYDVHIYTMKWWDEATKYQYKNGVHLHAISKLHALYHGERRSIKQGVFFGMAALKLISAPFDVIDVDHMPYFPLYSVRLVTWLRHKPMIATWHEVWGRAYWREYMGASGLIAAAIEKFSVLLPSKIIAVSDLTASRLRTDMRVFGPLETVSNGIDLARIKRVTKARRQSDLIYVGRLIEHKNIDVLVRVVAKLKANRPDISCVIIGSGPERERLERLANELGVQNNIRFLGNVPNHDHVLGHVKASKVFVTPSTREGFGVSLLEAHACGLTVVATNDPANAGRNLVTRANGRLTKLSVAAMARAVDELLSAPHNRKTVAATAEAYDWERSVAKLAEVYAS